MNYLGDFAEDSTVYLMFNTFTSNDPSASCTITNFAAGDVHIHKDDGLSQRNNAAGITVSVDFDGITGSHMIKIDTSDNTVAGFWVVGHEYFVRIEGITIDGATINSVVGQFSIENRFNEVDVVKWLGTAAATPTIAGVPEVDITHLLGTAWLAPGVAGTPDVNAKLLGGTAQTGNDVGADVNEILTDTGTTLDSLIKDVPTVAEFEARTIVTADYPTETEMTAAFTEIKGGTWAAGTDTLEHIRDKETDIETDTAVIGALGAGLTAIPWNSTWDAEVESECNDALVAQKLDHLVAVADADDAVNDSIVAKMAASDGDWSGFDKTADSLEAIRDRGDLEWITGGGGSDKFVLVDTTINTLATQTSFTLVAGSADDDAYNNCTIVIEDATTAVQKAVGLVSNYTGGSKTITLKYDPGIFTMAATDKIYILAENALKATAANRQLNVAADGDIAGNIDGSVASVSGHTAQTGDSFARLGSPVGASISADLVVIDNFVDDLETRLSAARAGYLDNLSAGAVALAAGVDLTKIHGVALTETVNGYLAAAFVKLFDVASPLLVASEVMRGTDSAYTGTPPTAAAIVNEWESQSQADPTGFHVNVKEVNGTAQTANDNSADINSILTDTAEIGAAGAGLTDLGGMSTGMKAEVESETNDALIALNLDHLMKTATGGADMTSEVVDNTVLSRILANGDTSIFAPSTDGLQPIRDQGDSAWITAAGFSTHSAADIWTVVTRALTDKSGFALSATGANLILKDSTFALALADAVADEELTGATHNVVNSLGRRVREIGAYAINSGTAQAGNATCITLAATASAVDGTYNRNLLVITDNTGVGQTRTIIDYDGSTKIAIIDREWRTNPDATTVYQIVADDTPLVVDQGVAQAGSTSSTIKLRAYASSINDTYLCNIVIIVAGTGRGQARLVGAYDGTSKVVTLCGDNWVTTPDDTSVYVMIPYGATCTSCVGDDALDQIDTVCDTALTNYDPPTRTEATTDKNAIITEVNGNETKIDALNDITVADIIAGIADGSYDLQEMMRIMFAALSGKSSGGGTVTLKFRDSGDAKDRISATVDATGNRTAITLDGS